MARSKAVVTAPTTYEDALWTQGYSTVAGVDEVGRGPLAGPVVTCAVILPQWFVIEGVNDSKTLSEKRREELALQIKANAIAYSYGIVDVEKIEEINILWAAMLAMEQAVNGLSITPDAVLVDGNRLPNLQQHAVCITKGDTKSHMIAAASILAKVKRDKIMQELHDKYPMYGFNKHKGYGTAMHRKALLEHGLCPQHRRGFCKL